MYLDYFSLDRHPFRITPDPTLFFEGGKDGRGVILNALIYGITSGEGILKVVGEVGSGKTMLCRMLEEKLPASVEIVYLANPRLSAREILYAIAIELKLEVTAATERLKAMHMLQDYLLTKHSQGGTVVVFIEEAQSMPLETLEEIRLLSNLETHQHKLMQIVLFGQPELDKILAQKNIRQLRERITHSFRLEPLDTEATSDYLRYRLQAAGCPRQHIFSPRAEKLIAQASSGLTRRINILADKSLLAAYADSPSRQPQQDSDVPLVQPRHVKAAIRDSDYKRRGANPLLWGSLALTATVVAVIVAISLELAPASSPLLAQADPVATGSDEPQTALTGQVERAAQEENPPATAATGQATEAPVDAATQALVGSPDGELALPGTDLSAGAGTEQAMATAVVEIAAASDTMTLAMADAVPDAGVAPAVSETPVGTDPRRQATAAQATEAGLEEGGEMPAATTVVAGNAESEVSGQDAEAAVLAPPVTVLPAGLTERRMAPTAQWLRSLDSKTGYTIQMFSVPSTNPSGLEEYLQFLQLVSLLDDTYICFMPISSPTSGRWQVMHKEFTGVTPARSLIAELPAYITQYGPYVRNLNGVECSYPVDTRD